jgi:hypothetical protein
MFNLSYISNQKDLMQLNLVENSLSPSFSPTSATSNTLLSAVLADAVVDDKFW